MHSYMMPFEPSTYSPMGHHYPMHHGMPSSPMHSAPMHPMHHGMPSSPMHSAPMHPMYTPYMPSHSMNNAVMPSHHMPSHHMSSHHMPSTHMSMTPYFGGEHMMTPFNGMSSMMNPMANWMRHQLPREVRDVVFRPMNVLEYNTFVNPIVYHPDGSRMLHLCFDVKGFKPEEVKVEVMAKERAIVVEAKHEVKDKEHNVTRNYLRKFIMPEEVTCDLSKVELKSVLTHDGMLVLESVLPRITPEELKAIREKAPSKTTPYSPVAPVTHHGHHAVSVPVKMN